MFDKYRGNDPSETPVRESADEPDSGSIGLAEDCQEISFGETKQGTVEDTDNDCYTLEVFQGDVCEITVGKEQFEDVQVRIDWPDGNWDRLGDESEDILTRRVTVETPGQLELTVYTNDEGPYEYELTPTVDRGADQWPGTDYHEVEFGETYTGTVHSPDDVDRLTFPVEQGDVCEFSLSKTQFEDVQIRIDWPDGNWDRLGDESAEVLARSITAEEPGHVECDIYSNSMEAGELDDFDWELTPTVDKGADQWPGTGYQEVEFGETYTGTVHSPDDADRLTFPVEQGDVCEFSLSKTQFEDVQIRIDWPDGNWDRLGDEDAEVLARSITAEEPGHVECDIYSRSMEAGDLDAFDWELTPTVDKGADQWPGTGYQDVEFGETYTGTVHSPDDVDRLTFPVEQGDVCEFSLSKTRFEDVQIRIDWPDGNWDRLGDESAEVLARSITAEEPGHVECDIYSRSMEAGELDAFDWELTPTIDKGADQWPGTGYHEVEPNIHSGTIHSPDDTDRLKIEVDADETVDLTLQKQRGEDVGIRIDWPDGNWDRLDDEDAEVLDRSVTAEEPGHVECSIYSRSMEAGDLDAFDWSLTIGDSDDFPDTGTVTGVVTDTNDEPLEDVELTFTEIS